MIRHSSAASLVLAVLTVVGLAGPTAAGEKVPFKGNLEGVVTRTPVDPPFVFVLVDGTGKANHLGKFTLAIPHVVNPVTRTAAGTYEFTASNGDTLSADFTGASAPTATPGVLSIVETATITGGTGRFNGATGSFTTERLFDTMSGTTAGSFQGTLRLRGGHDDDDERYDD
ncbi:MAG: hypothetical protein ACYC4U_14060 [Pirellulaceae bacterium]